MRGVENTAASCSAPPADMGRKLCGYRPVTAEDGELAGGFIISFSLQVHGSLYCSCSLVSPRKLTPFFLLRQTGAHPRKLLRSSYVQEKRAEVQLSPPRPSSELPHPR